MVVDQDAIGIVNQFAFGVFGIDPQGLRRALGDRCATCTQKKYYSNASKPFHFFPPFLIKAFYGLGGLTRPPVCASVVQKTQGASLRGWWFGGLLLFASPKFGAHHR